MFYASGKNICNRLDTPMRMPGEPCQIVFGVFVAKIVQKKEGVEFIGLPETKRPLKEYSSPFSGGLRPGDPFYGSN